MGRTPEAPEVETSSLGRGSGPPEAPSFASPSASLRKTIIAEMPVLNASASRSSPTFFTIVASVFASAFVSGRSTAFVSVTSRFARLRKLWTPFTPDVCQGFTTCNGPMNIS